MGSKLNFSVPQNRTAILAQDFAFIATDLFSISLERYPSVLAAGLVDIQNLFLFPKDKLIFHCWPA